jgi:hypothetical protein
VPSFVVIVLIDASGGHELGCASTRWSLTICLHQSGINLVTSSRFPVALRQAVREEILVTRHGKAAACSSVLSRKTTGLIAGLKPIPASWIEYRQREPA